jgi:transposase-like protein
MFGVERARSTAHNWVHKAELQPEDGQFPDQVAVDETVIWIDGEQYWLYAAVDPESNEFPHTSLETTTNKYLAQSFIDRLRDKHHVDNAEFLIGGSDSLH